VEKGPKICLPEIRRLRTLMLLCTVERCLFYVCTPLLVASEVMSDHSLGNSIDHAVYFTDERFNIH